MKKSIPVAVAACLGALVGFFVFLFVGVALFELGGFMVAVYFGLPVGGLVGAAGAIALANRQRPPGTPRASTRGHWTAAGYFVLLMFVLFGGMTLKDAYDQKQRMADRSFVVQIGTGNGAGRYQWMHSPRGFWDEHSETAGGDAAYREVGPLVVDGQPGTLAQDTNSPTQVFIPDPDAGFPRLLQRDYPDLPWHVVGRMTLNR